MKALQRRTSSFDTRSVMLFAALSLGSMGVLQAQTGGSSAQPAPASKPAAQAAQGEAGKYSYGPGTGNPSVAAMSAFQRADANKDGQLSEKEATQLPAISQRFKELDTDQSGSLSPSEFEKGLLS